MKSLRIKIACQLILSVFFTVRFGQASQMADVHGVPVRGDRVIMQSLNRPSLRVDLTTDKSTYRLGESIRINALLTNQSNSPIYLFAALDWGGAASFSLWIKDAISGKDIPSDFIADAMSPPPTSKDDFIKLLPEHVYGIELTSTVSDLSIRKKGTYHLILQYHSPVPSNMGFGLPIWTREMGVVPSQPVLIHVTQ
jgi:hypothetical protein